MCVYVCACVRVGVLLYALITLIIIAFTFCPFLKVSACCVERVSICLSVCLNVCLSLHVYVCMYVYPFLCPGVSLIMTVRKYALISPSVRLFLHSSACLPACVRACVRACVPACLPAWLPAYQSALCSSRPYGCLSVYLCI